MNWEFETECRAPERRKPWRGCGAWMRCKARRRPGRGEQDV